MVRLFCYALLCWLLTMPCSTLLISWTLGSLWHRLFIHPFLRKSPYYPKETLSVNAVHSICHPLSPAECVRDFNSSSNAQGKEMARNALPPNNKPRVCQISSPPVIRSGIHPPNRLSSRLLCLLGPNASADGKSSRAMEDVIRWKNNTSIPLRRSFRWSLWECPRSCTWRQQLSKAL